MLLTIDPHQFLGIEVNPRAAAITDLVLWIGYLQWHFRTRGDDELREPIIRNFHNIECRDAVLACDRVEPVVDEQGNPVTRWDGRTTRPHPVTSEEVTNETARVQELRYINPRKAEWPKADYVVGNPPFVGVSKMRFALGSGYVDALHEAHDDMPKSCDYVMYWWNSAANSLRSSNIRRFGFITTNSITKVLNRRIVENHLVRKSPVTILFCVPDHPWVDAADGAAVRISMTVCDVGSQAGTVNLVRRESIEGGDTLRIEFATDVGPVNSNLSIGVDINDVTALKSNDGMSSMGVKLHGTGFVLSSDEAAKLTVDKSSGAESVIKPYVCARDLTATNRNQFVID